MSKSVLYACEARIARVTLNRPDNLNSLDTQTAECLTEALDRAVADGAVAVILTGAGRAFCSGADLSSVLSLRDADGAIDLGSPMRSHFNPLIRRLATLPIPVVVAVNGIAAGGGASLAIAGDLVIAARSAAFRFTFASIGLVPDLGATARLPRLVGRARARGAALLGEAISAEQAQDWGLIWAVVDDDALADMAQAVATRLAGLSPATVADTRRLLDAGEQQAVDAAIDAETHAQETLGRQPAFQAAVEQFLARRRRG